MSAEPRNSIHIQGASQNNLQNVSLDITLNQITVVTGVSGSGKSSLVFDTLYAEGQRRYVETFSPYARQFLDRMDKPRVDRIDGVPPAIAIDQTGQIRTSRSTVGTMTELADHFKLLYARAARLYCRCCNQPVQRDTVATILSDLYQKISAQEDPRLIICFPFMVSGNLKEYDVIGLLEQQGYTRIHCQKKGDSESLLEVVQDRFRFSSIDPVRLSEALEVALQHGKGRVSVFEVSSDGKEKHWSYSTDLHCPTCDIRYADPTPGLFSFNSPIGACETCRGFGRIIGVDFGLVIPDESKTLAEGAIKPWQTQSYNECQRDLEKMARKYGVAMDIPFQDLPVEHQHWVLEGDQTWKSWESSWPRKWYGVRRFFEWLETKAYKMHIRVLLSRYRSYTECPACCGSRLKPEALLWRFPFSSPSAERTELSINDLMSLPVSRIQSMFEGLNIRETYGEAAGLVLDAVQSRLQYLTDVGLGYLTLDRQSRTLSGGEIQRINLTTALGSSLVNTLFVLDEPSIGLHPRDIGRILTVMTRLRDAGNTLVVVEHDPQVMLAADEMLEIGPGPGEKGGRLVARGTSSELILNPDSVTGPWLSGKKRMSRHLTRRLVDQTTPCLTLTGVCEHNLKNVTVRFPLQRFVCLTGVSGSGKSTLIQDVLYPALARQLGENTVTPGVFETLQGVENLQGIVLVDQSPIGKSARSNPVSYVGAWDGIRALFAGLPDAQERGYSAATFSFNAGNGRCPTCTGSGFEHVEMQFLSDVWLRCPDCDGKRYRSEILELRWQSYSIADILEMTVNEAMHLFKEHSKIQTALEPLQRVGLGYVRLGQPVPTLSGGEAQRLKLAAYLGEAAKKNRSSKKKKDQPDSTLLFLFDEPTTGLHFEDISVLLEAFYSLLEAGHSLIVIEHNLDVMRAADWLIDLGPEGGDAGGEIVAEGTPEEICDHPASHTGKALRDYIKAQEDYQPVQVKNINGSVPAEYEVSESQTSYLSKMTLPVIQIRHAREHNLKNISLDIPRGGLTVVTGLSGSGKSTLAFDIVFGEGQRRYLESLNAYSRQFVQPASRPDVDGVFGIPPSVAIEQRTSRGGRKSTVATLTEIHPFLRLLYTKLGTQFCPCCDVAVTPQSPEAILNQIMQDFDQDTITVLAPLVNHRKGLYTELARWARGKGHTHLRVDGALIPTEKWPRLDRYKEHTVELPVGTVEVSVQHKKILQQKLTEALEYGKGVFKVICEHDQTRKQVTFSTQRACSECGTSFPELDPRQFSYSSKQGWCPACYGTGLKTAAKIDDPEALDLGESSDAVSTDEICPKCEGARLNPVSRSVRFRHLSLQQLVGYSAEKMADFFNGLSLSEREKPVAGDLINEIQGRLHFLCHVGLGYLSLERSAPTLSGGEAQRIRLAAQLGSNLKGVCYVLDEPTIGLHPRDNALLLETLIALRDRGNTLLVVEHDEETMRRADHVIDLGPGAGIRGGEVVAQGQLQDLIASETSVTGACLREPLRHPLYTRREIKAGHQSIQVKKAFLHNLRDITVSIPLERLTVVTGVSGSGKSSLVRDVIHTNLLRLLGDNRNKPDDPALVGCEAITGWQQIGRVLEVDQTPIGKTSRSCPATYVGFWDAIRKCFAETFDARTRGWTASRFSFNTGNGRCPLCEGQGLTTVEMNFLPDVKTTCEACGGARFNPETLTVRWRGKTVAEVLAMPVDEAVVFFAAHPVIRHPLQLLQDVGLGYLTLGQPSSTLSGGEAQRIKLVTELAKVKGTSVKKGSATRLPPEKHTFYVLDEPTVGLHMADVEKLIHVLHRLVNAGHTVLVVEHDLDMIAEADWLIDLGPEGGEKGGHCVVEGPPEVTITEKRSHTGYYLKAFMAARSS